jgi:hypothetical protein
MNKRLVSKKEIDAFVTFAIREGVVVDYNEKEYKVAECPDYVGQMLWNASHESAKDSVNEVVTYPTYAYSETSYPDIAIYKSIMEYDGQTSYMDEYEKSFAYAFFDAMNPIVCGKIQPSWWDGDTYDKVPNRIE